MFYLMIVNIITLHFSQVCTFLGRDYRPPSPRPLCIKVLVHILQHGQHGFEVPDMNYNMYGDLQLQHTVMKSEDTPSHLDHHFTTNIYFISLSLLLHGNGNYFSIAPKILMTI